MKPTNDKFFADSNIFLYLLDEFGYKKDVAKKVLTDVPVISTQVIAENMNVLFKKFSDRLTIQQISTHKNTLLNSCTVINITPAIIETAFDIKTSYSLQWYDSMIVAAALHANCSILYSEDMQHNLVVKNTLTIINPFI